MKVRHFGEMIRYIGPVTWSVGSLGLVLHSLAEVTLRELTTLGFSFSLKCFVQFCDKQIMHSRAEFLIGGKGTAIRFKRDPMKCIAMPSEIVWKQLS